MRVYISTTKSSPARSRARNILSLIAFIVFFALAFTLALPILLIIGVFGLIGSLYLGYQLRKWRAQVIEQAQNFEQQVADSQEAFRSSTRTQQSNTAGNVIEGEAESVKIYPRD